MSSKRPVKAASEKIKTLYDEISGRDLVTVFLQNEDFVTFPNLMRVAKAVVGPERWHHEPTYQTRKVLRRAIRRLPTEMSGRHPGRPQSTADNNFWKGKKERRAAEMLYGYRQEEIRAAHGYSPDDRDYKPRLTYTADYLPAALKILELDQETDENRRKLPLRVLWQDLEKALLTLEKEAHRRREEAKRKKQVAEYAVIRPQLEGELDDAIAEGNGNERLTWVHGEPGTGKTTIVNRVLSNLSGQVVRIKCAAVNDIFQLRSMRNSLISALRSHGLSADGDDDTLRYRFVELLCGDDAPKYVVIENHEAGTFPEMGIVHPYQAQVIIESRFPPPEELERQANNVEVGKLTPEETRELVRHYAPSTDDCDCDELRTRLEGNATLIKQAAIAVADANRTIREYLEGIGIRGATYEKSDYFREHYVYIIEQLRSQNPVAFDIFFTVLVVREGIDLYSLKILKAEMSSPKQRPDEVMQLGRDAIPSDLADLIDRMGHVESIGPVPDNLRPIHVEQAVNKAIDDLQRRGLLKIESECIETSFLTRLLIADYFPQDVSKSALSVTLALVTRTQKWGWGHLDSLPYEVLSLTAQSVSAIAIAVATYSEESGYVDRLEFASAVLWRASRQYKILDDRDTAFEICLTALGNDNRKLVFAPRPGILGPSPMANLEPSVAIAPASSKEGCSQLVGEMLAVYPEDSFPTGSDRDEINALWKKIGIYIEADWWFGIKRRSLEFGVWGWFDGDLLHNCRLALLRQQSGRGDDVQLDRSTDCRLLLLFGRYLAATGNIDSAAAILLFNARTVCKIAGVPEYVWIATESYRICGDLLLRAGRLSESEAVLAEMQRELALRTETPDFPDTRFALIDAPLNARMSLTIAEVRLSRAILGRDYTKVDEFDDALLSVCECVAFSYRIGVNFLEREILFSTFELSFRLATIIELVQNGTFGPFKIPKAEAVTLPAITRKELDYWKIRSGPYERFYEFVGMVFALMEELQEAGSSAFRAIVDRMQESTSFTGTRVSATDRPEYRAVAHFSELLTALCDKFESEHMHWHDIARHRVIAAYAAVHAFDSLDNEIVSSGISCATRYGRHDWVEIIKVAKTYPLSIVLMLLK
ncbi:hypothetical protein ACQPXH_23955 [Nocardia sp. CA-135953]|uniref:hypothetical protein n=1 Tax=Nocardia sp. CA-135953 TaxID=3239978 RepID=UPI003D952228